MFLSEPTLSREKQVINKVSSPGIIFSSLQVHFSGNSTLQNFCTKGGLRFKKARRVLTSLWEASLWHPYALGCNLQAYWEMSENLVFCTQCQNAC